MPNVFEQNVPLVVTMIENVLKNKLMENEYPFTDMVPLKDIPKNIIIYIIGGVTFGEAKQIKDLNQKYPDCHFIIGGSSQINSKMFFDDYIIN